MANLNHFDATQVEPSASLDPLPAAKYIAVITESEMKPTKSGNGQYLELTLQVVEGPYAGRLVWARLNLQNRNETTVKIAKGELSAICRAVNILQPKDSIELHGIPLEIKVSVKKRDDNGELTNEVKGFARKGAAVVPALTTNGIAPPWKR